MFKTSQFEKQIKTDTKFWGTNPNSAPNYNWYTNFHARMGVSFWSITRSVDQSGGDMWATWHLDQDRIAILVGDISGKGKEAAYLRPKIQAAIDKTISKEEKPDKSLSHLNESLLGHLPKGHYIAMLYGILDFKDQSFTYAGAAWPWPLIIDNTNKQIIHGDGSGIPVGLIKNASYETRKASLPTQGTLILYSDGVSESKSDKSGCKINKNSISDMIVSAWSEDQTRLDYNKLFSLPSDLKVADDYMVVICHFGDKNKR